MRKLALFAFSATLLLRAQQQPGDYQPGPDSQPQEGVPKGTVTRQVLPPGKFYPGTPHNYAVYVPAQYDPTKPTAFMIFMDGGNGGRNPVVFDNLIAKKDIPPMIAIFIDPGVLPTVSPNAQNRRERIFEYDNISDRFSHFLVEELIPEVSKKYNLSKNPDDRGLCGTSTGAVAAFTAAWHRPDQFHRVLSIIGTYVSMKGADTFPAMIRRTEPKPLRILLQAGKNDHIVPGQEFGVFYAGSWPINNQLMYEALQFQGYDVKFDLGTGGHDGRQAAALMPDYMRWLWREYPKPIVVHEPAVVKLPGWEPRGQVFANVWADKGWEKVGAAHQSLTPPATDKDGNVWYADASRIYKADASGKESVFRDNVRGLKAVRAGADGRIYAADSTARRIVSYGASGDEKVVASGISASDLALTAKGEIYYLEGKTAGYIDAKGQKHVMTLPEVERPTALSLTTDQAMVLIGDAGSRYSWSYQVGSDGMPINGEPFFRIDIPEMTSSSGITGVTVDAINQPWFAGSLGIQICEQNGRCGATLAKPAMGNLTGIALTSLPDNNFMYAAVDGQVYRRPVKRGGVSVNTPVKPPNPPL